jgi:phosphate transport system substrate-binding protein
MKWVLAAIFGGALAAVVASLLVGGGRHGRALNIVGSTSVQPFAEMLAQEYNRLHPDEPIDVQGGGSTAGIQAVQSRIADIGTCSRSLSAEEKAAGCNGIEIARDGLAVVVHPSNNVAGLTRAQVRGLFSGAITNWKQVGGPDRIVRLISREEGSGTREAFVKLLMVEQVPGPVGPDGKPSKTKIEHRVSSRALTQESNGAVQELVRHDPSAVGYMSLGLVGPELRMVAIDGVSPSVQAAESGKYPLVRPFLFVTIGEPSERSQRFIDFVLSPQGQQMLQKEGLVRSSLATSRPAAQTQAVKP